MQSCFVRKFLKGVQGGTFSRKTSQRSVATIIFRERNIMFPPAILLKFLKSQAYIDL